MIVIRVKVSVKPENKSDFINVMQDSIAISREFDGCQHFGLYQDVMDDTTLILYEEWETQAQFDAYKASDHFKESGKQLFALMNGAPDSAYFNAEMIPVS